MRVTLGPFTSKSRRNARRRYSVSSPFLMRGWR